MAGEPGTIIRLRRDTAAEWTTDNPVLALGETGWETDTRRVKLGDGVTAWVDLPYAADEAASVAAEQARAEAAEAVLQDNIDAEAVSRVDADTELDERLDVLTDLGEQMAADVKFVGGAISGIAATPVALDTGIAIVPPSTRPQLVRFQAPMAISVTGGGSVTLQLYDYTAGVATLREYTQRRVASTEPVTSAGDTIRGEHRIDPHTDWRVLQLYFTLARDGGSSLQVNVPSLGQDYGKTVVQVVKQ